MNWTLEVVVVPVSNVERAKAFYAERLSFNVDHDTQVSAGNRIVQLTPPGSGCSIVVGEGIVPDMPPGSLKGLQLVVPDVNAARAQLIERGVQVLGESPTPQPDPLDNVGFVFFSDEAARLAASASSPAWLRQCSSSGKASAPEQTAVFASQIAVACYQTARRQTSHDPRALVGDTREAFDRVLGLGRAQAT